METRKRCGPRAGESTKPSTQVIKGEKEVSMNKVLLACAVIALASPAFAREYKHSGCRDAAEMKFPTDRTARKDFKHWCKDQWKMYKASHP